MIHGHRGGVVGAIATAGVAVSSPVPMFIGAMVIGPLGGYLIKSFDRFIRDKIPMGLTTASYFPCILNEANFNFGGDWWWHRPCTIRPHRVLPASC